MKPVSKVESIKGIGGGNPPGILRAEVRNIFPTGAIIVKLQVEPLDKKLRSIGTLSGLIPPGVKLKIGDIVDVTRTPQGSFEFVRKIGQAASKQSTMDTSAIPHEIKRELNTSIPLSQPVPAAPNPALPSLPVVSLKPSIASSSAVLPILTTKPVAAVKPEKTIETAKTEPISIDAVNEYFHKGSRLNRQVIKEHMTEELLKEIAAWIIKAKVLIRSFIAEENIGLTQELVSQHGKILAMAHIINKFEIRLKYKSETLNIPQIDPGIKIEDLPKTRRK